MTGIKPYISINRSSRVVKLLLNVKDGSKIKSRPLQNQGLNAVGHQEYRPACNSEDDETPRKQDNKRHNSQRGMAVGCDFTVSASRVVVRRSRLLVMAIARDSRGLQSPREPHPNPLHDLSVLSADDAKGNLSK